MVLLCRDFCGGGCGVWCYRAGRCELVDEAFLERQVLDDVEVVVARDVFGVVHERVEGLYRATEDSAVCRRLVEVGSQLDADTLCVGEGLDNLLQPCLVNLEVFDQETRGVCRGVFGFSRWRWRCAVWPSGWEAFVGLRCGDGDEYGRRHGEETKIICRGGLMLCVCWRGRWWRWRRRW